jgi:hypothetical protein
MLPATTEAQEAAAQLHRSANAVRADECVDWLEYLREMRITANGVLLQEAQELARIFARSVKTARENTSRSKRA